MSTKIVFTTLMMFLTIVSDSERIQNRITQELTSEQHYFSTRIVIRGVPCERRPSVFSYFEQIQIVLT